MHVGCECRARAKCRYVNGVLVLAEIAVHGVHNEACQNLRARLARGEAPKED
jgi:ornithine cyclodeaminase/alanine dehydrogenase-like protein (mu-crystallin family)